jgi:hypothetical protein
MAANKPAAKPSAAGTKPAKPGAKECDAIFDEDVAEPRRGRGPCGSRRSAVDRLDDPPPQTGLLLIDRVQRAIEREISQIETVIGVNRLSPEHRSEAESCARTLAHLTRTLSELGRLRTDREANRPADDDAIPRDLDELRRALSRLEQLVA